MQDTAHTLCFFSGLDSISRHRLRSEADRLVVSLNERPDLSPEFRDYLYVDDAIVFGSLDKMLSEGGFGGEKRDLTADTRKFDSDSCDSAVVLAFLLVLNHTFESVWLKVNTSAKATFLKLAMEIDQRHCPSLPSPPWMLKYIEVDSLGIPDWMDFRS